MYLIPRERPHPTSGGVCVLVGRVRSGPQVRIGTVEVTSTVPTRSRSFYRPASRSGRQTGNGSGHDKWDNTTFFRWLEVLEGTFIKTYMSQSCLGCIVEVFCVVGMQEMRIPTLKCRFYLLDRWGTCTYTGSTGSFFRCLEVLEGTFVRTHMRQSCLGCILEVF